MAAVLGTKINIREVGIVEIKMIQGALSVLGISTALAFAGVNHVVAATLFAEDFESYAVGTNLIGQGGWFGGNDPVIVNNIGPLPTRVADGVNSISGSFFGNASHAILGGLPTDSVSTVTFDGFASNGSHDSWAGLSNTNDGISLSTSITWDINGFSSQGPVGWTFNIRQSTGPLLTRFSTGSGLGTPAKFTIIIDPMALQAWGTFDFGAGATETPHVAVAAGTIAALDAVNIGFDFRGTRGIQVDNIIASSIPVPAALYLMLSCLPIGIRIVRKNRSPRS